MIDRKGGDHYSFANHYSRPAAGATASSSAMGGAGSGARLRRTASSDDRPGGNLGSGSLGGGHHFGSSSSFGSMSAPDTPSHPPLRRRSSNFSDYSQEARDILNPTPLAGPDALREDEQQGSGWESLPLAFALLPALGGLFVQGGSAFVTDLMLLALGAIFLHWSVTQPWAWYRSAQQIREDHQQTTEYAVDSVSDSYDDDADDADDEIDEIDEITEDGTKSAQPLEDVPEEEEASPDKAQPPQPSSDKPPAKQDDAQPPAGTAEAAPPPTKDASLLLKQKRLEQRQAKRRQYQARHDAALRELYRHEVLALLSCFVSPLLGAYLLHTLRDQLTRPSEGLISNYNLSIFLLGAEIRPLRHLIQLVQARTLHLQRIVHANPYRDEEEAYRARRAQEERTQNRTLSGLVARLESLEQGSTAASTAAASSADPDARAAPAAPASAPPNAQRDREQLLRDLKATIQPELDTLARALRRAHKQQTLLEGQVAARFRTTDQRLNDAVAVATAASLAFQQQQQQQQQTQKQRRRWGLGGAVDAVLGTAVGTALGTSIAWTAERVLGVVLFVPRLVAGKVLGRLSPFREKPTTTAATVSSALSSYNQRSNGKNNRTAASATTATNGNGVVGVETSSIGSRRATSPDTTGGGGGGGGGGEGVASVASSSSVRSPVATIQQGKLYRTSAKR